jgi:catalase
MTKKGLTSASGAPIAHNNNSMTAGRRGMYGYWKSWRILIGK